MAMGLSSSLPRDATLFVSEAVLVLFSTFPNVVGKIWVFVGLEGTETDEVFVSGLESVVGKTFRLRVAGELPRRQSFLTASAVFSADVNLERDLGRGSPGELETPTARWCAAELFVASKNVGTEDTGKFRLNFSALTLKGKRSMLINLLHGF